MARGISQLIMEVHSATKQVLPALLEKTVAFLFFILKLPNNLDCFFP